MFFRAIAVTLALTAGVAGASEQTRFESKVGAYAVDTVMPFNPKSLCVCNESSKLGRTGALYKVTTGYLTCAIPVFDGNGNAYAILDCFQYTVLSK